ncbi:unnamed protein product [Acanthoscelides obtectus]|uniref:Sec16 Sec23-binding domain-containing protein n=1 Tax=Acanthoscelides obtectus TaxID=200917 RepID=A0A9P0PHI8_ACAOB|nr:unnamed protein product [Acanthoscelides obtectus]CAK1674946.1 Protein transport protein Sec31A [Acanthoscelides obtectus]
MKLKDIERTANVAWSPKSHYPIHLAAGTAAQQLDASFSTNAALEIYSLNVTDPGPDMQLVSSVPSDHRFHKIIWGSVGSEPGSGTIIGGCDGGLIQIYNASKLLKNEDALMGRQEKHSGPVHSLDFNGFQQNLFASGAANSEIFIWDLNNIATPMSPGAKCQPLEDVLSVLWNKQVQHILATTFSSKCVIWDLRKNEPIIKLTDTVSRVHWKVVAWHPEVATQLCLASDEDHSPIIQLWDLRFATSPLKTLENHQRGILSMAWCNDDSDLLASCGKDNRILIWNPNGSQPNGEVLAELAKTNQWNFDVLWCPRNPALIACPNFDGHVSIYSLMGGKTQQIQTTNKIADSFPGMDGYMQAPVPQQQVVTVSVDLAKPPKWLKRPVGASFGFGGKLICFENDKAAVAHTLQNVQPGQQPPHIPRTVQISQVITEATLVKHSQELEKALEYGNFAEYCINKMEETKDQHQKTIWQYLRASFEANPRVELLSLLGYNIESINNKLNQHVGTELNHNVNGLSDDFANMNRLDDFAQLDNQIHEKKGPSEPLKIKTTDDTEGLVTQALLLNNIEAAVALCLKAKKYADALIIATTGGPDLLARTQHKYLEQCEGYISSLISAVVSEDWTSIINNCEVSSWKEALAATLTHASDEDLPGLCEQLGDRLTEESKRNPKLMQDAQLCYLCAGSFDKLVNSWSQNRVTDTNKMQQLIELMMLLQKAVERQGRRVQVSGALADLLTRYAFLLVSQGELTTASAYLGTSHDQKISTLRERIQVALGQKQSFGNQHDYQNQGRRSSHKQSFSQSYPGGPVSGNTNPFNTPNQYSSIPPVNPPQPAQFNTGLPNQSTTQPWQPQPPVPAPSFSPAPPPLTQPPRPGSVGSSHGGISSRSKYVLDPSVSSGPSYGVSAARGFPPPIDAPMPNSSLSSNTPYFVPPLAASGHVPAPMNPTPLNPVAPAPSPAAAYGAPLPPPPKQTELYAAPSGWNDPPPLSSRPSKAEPKPEAPPSDPITHPLYGAGYPTDTYGNDIPSQPPPSMYNPAMPPQPYQQPPGAAFPPPTGNFAHQSNFQHPGSFPAPGSTFPPPVTGGYDIGAMSRNAVPPQVAQEAMPRAETPQHVQKPPIPQEHEELKRVFDKVRERCSDAANNPQTKRKLEDVARKLETLYDLLREQKLWFSSLQ